MEQNCHIIDKNSNIEYNIELTDTLTIVAIKSTIDTYQKWEVELLDSLITKDGDKKYQVTLRLPKVYEMFVGFRNNTNRPEIKFVFPSEPCEDGSLLIMLSTEIPGLGPEYVDQKHIVLNSVNVDIEEKLTNKLKVFSDIFDTTVIETSQNVSKMDNYLLKEIALLKEEVETLKNIINCGKCLQEVYKFFGDKDVQDKVFKYLDDQSYTKWKVLENIFNYGGWRKHEISVEAIDNILDHLNNYSRDSACIYSRDLHHQLCPN